MEQTLSKHKPVQRKDQTGLLTKKTCYGRSAVQINWYFKEIGYRIFLQWLWLNGLWVIIVRIKMYVYVFNMYKKYIIGLSANVKDYKKVKG